MASNWGLEISPHKISERVFQGIERTDIENNGSNN